MIHRTICRLVLLLAVLALPAAAQTPVNAGTSQGWTKVRIAKWTMLGVAVGFGGYAIAQTSRAQSRYEDLGRICVTEPGRCRIRNGQYEDPMLEALYDASGEHDRRAQIGIAGAHVALVGSVALFIYDLRNARGPRNIPYPAHGASASPILGVGARVRF